MLMRRYEMPWRRAYEIYAGAAWLMAMAFFAAVGATHQLPRPLALPLALLCFAMGLLRIAQGVHTLVLRASLSGRARGRSRSSAPASWPVGAASPTRCSSASASNGGRCIRSACTNWPRSTTASSRVSPRLLALLGYDPKPQPDAEIGLPYIHGVEPREVPLHRPLQNFEGGTLLVGTTQSGKGVALASLITQAVRRGDVVIVIDPKNSRRLKRVTRARLPGLARGRHLPGVPPRLPRDRRAPGLHLQLAEAHRDRLAHPVDHAAGHGRRLLGLRLGRRQRGGARPGRAGGAAEPGQAHQVHRRRHRAGAGRHAAPLLRAHARAPAGASCRR